MTQHPAAEKSSGSRRESHVKPAIAKIHNTKPGSLVPQRVVSWFNQRPLDKQSDSPVEWQVMSQHPSRSESKKQLSQCAPDYRDDRQENVLYGS